MGFDKWLIGSVLDVFTTASPLLSPITTGILIVFWFDGLSGDLSKSLDFLHFSVSMMGR